MARLVRSGLTTKAGGATGGAPGFHVFGCQRTDTPQQRALVQFERSTHAVLFYRGMSQKLLKTDSVWWWALVFLCASCSLNVPMCAVGFALVGRDVWDTTGARETMLVAGLCAAQFLGASVGLAVAERVAFREKKQDQLEIASLLTFPVAFMAGIMSGLAFDLPAMERFAMFRWSTNTIAISTFILLPVTGVAGLVYAYRLHRELRRPKPPAHSN